MVNGQWQITKAVLFGRVGLRLGLLTTVLSVVACGTMPVVERPGPKASPVAVAEGGDSTLAIPTETTGPAATPTETVEPAVIGAPRPTSDAIDTMPTPIPGAQIAPDFSLPDLDGQMWTLSQFRGRPVMLFTWASW